MHPTPPELRRFEAVQLFVDRAHLSRSSFEASDANVLAIAAICRRVDGIPLAIELAAARTAVMPVDEILHRVNDRFRFLTSAGRTVTPRQQTLEATLNWSYELLDTGERMLMQRLAVFAGSFSLDAAEEICAGKGLAKDAILDMMASLVRKSLVIAVDDSGGSARFRLLETIREYAERLITASGDGQEFRRRHYDYFAALAAQSLAADDGGAAAAWMARIELDHSNMSNALDWAEARDGVLALELAASLGSFWHQRGYLREALTRLLTALGGADEPTFARALAMNHLGSLQMQGFDPEAAEGTYEKSLDLWQRIGNAGRAGRTLSNLGILYWGRSQLDKAEMKFVEGIEAGRSAGDLRTQAVCMSNLGVLKLERQELAEARGILNTARAMFASLDSLRWVAIVDDNLARLAMKEGDLDMARRKFASGMAVFDEIRDRNNLADSIEGLAELAATEGRFEQAITMAGAAERIRQDVGDVQLEIEEAKRRRWLDAAVQAVSDRSQRAWEIGTAMSDSQAITWARDNSAMDRLGEIVR